MDYDHITRTVPATKTLPAVLVEIYVLKGAELPTGFNYKITVTHCTRDTDLHIQSTSVRGSNGSRRYYRFSTLDDALAHGIAWARRVKKEITIPALSGPLPAMWAR